MAPNLDVGAAVRTLSKIAALAPIFIASFGASAQSDLDAKLLAAAQKANPTDVRAQLAAGADANARAADGSTAMLYAAHFGDAASVQALLAAKADPNLANRYGVGPMHEAALRADADLLANTSRRGRQRRSRVTARRNAADAGVAHGRCGRRPAADRTRRKRQRRRAVAGPDAPHVRGRARSRRGGGRIDRGGRGRQRENSDQRSAGARVARSVLR